mgnify:CR=1 FL=1
MQKNTSRKIAYFAIFASLIGANVFAIDLGFFQLSLFRMTIIAVVFLFLLSLGTKTQYLGISGKFANRFSVGFMIFWALYAVLSFFWVQDYNAWIKAVYFLILNVICIIFFMNTFDRSAQILTGLRVFAFMAILHNLIGWYEILARQYFFLDANLISLYRYLRYPVSIFGNTNDFATFMLISVFILFACMQNTKKKYMQYVYGATIVSSIVLLFMASSRANILGLLVALVVFVWLNLYNKKTQIFVFAMLLPLFFLIILKPDIFKNAFLMILDGFYFDTSSASDSINIRLNLLRNGVVFLINTYGAGTGAGNVEFWMANASVYGTSGIVNMHNWWMEILTGYGIIVFVLYITFYALLTRNSYMKYKNALTKTDKTISLCFLCSLIGYIIGGMSSSSNLSSEWLWVFWSIVITYQGLELTLPQKQIKDDKNDRRVIG